MRTTLRSLAEKGWGLGVLAFILAVIIGPAAVMGQQATNFGSASGVTCPGGKHRWFIDSAGNLVP